MSLALRVSYIPKILDSRLEISTDLEAIACEMLNYSSLSLFSLQNSEVVSELILACIMFTLDWTSGDLLMQDLLFRGNILCLLALELLCGVKGEVETLGGVCISCPNVEMCVSTSP